MYQLWLCACGAFGTFHFCRVSCCRFNRIIAPLVGNTLLCIITAAWFQVTASRLVSHVQNRNTWREGIRVAFPEPCTLPIVNAVKIAAYVGCLLRPCVLSR
jgi:hypothetical protein